MPTKYNGEHAEWIAKVKELASNADMNRAELADYALRWMMDCPYRIYCFLGWFVGKTGSKTLPQSEKEKLHGSNKG